MTFIQFLNWLYGVIYRVLDWFGDRFGIYLNILNTIDMLILAYVNGMRDIIVNWINPIIANIRQRATDLYNIAISYVNQKYNDAVGLYNGLVNQVNAILTAIQNWAITSINAVRNDLSVLAYNLYYDAKNFATSEVSNTRNWLLNTFNWMTPLTGFINPIILFFQPGNLAKVYQILNKDFSVINAFMSNPVGFMFDIATPYMLNTLGWIIAISLGHTKERLDVKPPWQS